MAAGDWSVNVHDLTFLAFDDLLDLVQIVFFPLKLLTAMKGHLHPPSLPVRSRRSASGDGF